VPKNRAIPTVGSSGIFPSLKLCIKTSRRNPGSFDFAPFFDPFRVRSRRRRRRESCSERRGQSEYAGHFPPLAGKVSAVASPPPARLLPPLSLSGFSTLSLSKEFWLMKGNEERSKKKAFYTWVFHTRYAHRVHEPVSRSDFSSLIIISRKK
jgi:hypothetical protein